MDHISPKIIKTAPMYLEAAEFPMLTAAGIAVTDAFKVLLEGKHLYQSVSISLSAIEEEADRLISDQHSRRQMTALGPGGQVQRRLLKDDYVYTGSTLLSLPWKPNLIPPGVLEEFFKRQLQKDKRYVSFFLPHTLVTYCSVCKGKWPFNPQLELGRSEYDEQTAGNEWHFLAFTCQHCKNETARFLVRRQGRKIRLSGRDPFPEVVDQAVLPKDCRKYYASAEVACNAGQILAGIFFLRVFIEQYYRLLPEVKKRLEANPRMSGEVMGAIYHEGLPGGFKEQFPSLPAIYAELSIAIHEAKEEPELYQRCAQRILKHFEARRLLELDIAK
jgi:hypothetical protein